MKRIYFIIAFFICTCTAAQYTQISTKLVGTGALGDAGQGCSVSISDNGNIAVVGGLNDNYQIGAAWVYTFNGTNFVQFGDKLVGTGYIGTPKQGGTVSISPNGNMIAVGGYLDNGGIGAVWIYSFDGSNFVQMGSKLVGAGIIDKAYFGVRVKFSPDGSILMVGGTENNDYEGALWVYSFNGSNFVQVGSPLVGNDINYSYYGATFGNSFDMSSDNTTIAIGGKWDNSQIGATWVFTFNGTNYIQYGSKLVGTNAIQNPNGSLGNGNLGSNQGHDLEISADASIIAVSGINDDSGKGAVWVFSFTGSSYEQMGSKIVSSSTSSVSGFGNQISLSANGKHLAVSASYDNNNRGAVVFYTLNGQNYITDGSKIVATDATQGSVFGLSTAISKDEEILIVGGAGNGNGVVGGIWVYENSDCELIPIPNISINNGQLICSSITDASYQWYLNETSIAGSNSNVLSNSIQIGSYKVSLKSRNCISISNPFDIGLSRPPVTIPGFCPPTVTVTVTSINTVTVTSVITVTSCNGSISGINESRIGKDLKVYPNPSNGLIQIQGDVNDLKYIAIYNSIGVLITIIPFNNYIDIRNIPTGNYALKLIDKESNFNIVKIQKE